jgi:N-acetyl-gamma-glutamyl-phosphate reductase
MTIEVGIFGATGYTGLELTALLQQHPQANLRFLTSESSAGKSLRQSWPLAPDIPLIHAAAAAFGQIQCALLCLPHTRSAPIAAQALAQGVRVIDLSADLRIDDPAEYERWYSVPHPDPDLLPTPYGLPELGRDALAGATCIANPGCYPTATLLGLVPLARHNLLIPDTPIIVDAKSGASGAGRTPKPHTLFCEVHGNFSPYSIGRAHRHISEMDQVLAREGVEPGGLIFAPHLLPTDRGILETIYVQVRDIQAAREAFEEMYADEPLVNVLPPGETATLAHVVRTPHTALSLTPATDTTLIVVVALDNLLKGAASQAVQNFNLMWGFPETLGLINTGGKKT